MNKNILKLLQKLDKDEKLLNEFSQKNSIDELFEFSLSLVDGYTKEEFMETMESIAKQIYENSENKPNTKEKAESSIIPEKELDQVSGGRLSPAEFFGGVSKVYGALPGIKNQVMSGFNLGKAIKNTIKSSGKE